MIPIAVAGYILTFAVVLSVFTAGTRVPSSADDSDCDAVCLTSEREVDTDADDEDFGHARP